jgi:tRNA threonylcarbamoyladenosine biosynthesis protein TsaB
MQNSNILAIDTSNNYLSLAVKTNSGNYYILERVENLHSKYIIIKIQELLQQSKISISEISQIAYISGPGSFTGLRVGLSIALGIGCGLTNSPTLIAIPTFALYAKATGTSNNLFIVLDAQMKQVYVAGINPVSLDYFYQPQLLDPQDFMINSNCIITGNGFIKYQQLFSSLSTNPQFIDIDYPHPSYILDIIAQNKYPAQNIDTAQLNYIKNKVALTKNEQIFTTKV